MIISEKNLVEITNEDLKHYNITINELRSINNMVDLEYRMETKTFFGCFKKEMPTTLEQDIIMDIRDVAFRVISLDIQDTMKFEYEILDTAKGECLKQIIDSCKLQDIPIETHLKFHPVLCTNHNNLLYLFRFECSTMNFNSHMGKAYD